MAIGTNSYSTVLQVAALVRKYTDKTTKTFTTGTYPTLAQVETWIDNVSGIVNILLAEAGFSIPVSQADAKLALDQFVAEEVAALCEGANSSGRFYTGIARERGAFRVIISDVENFIASHAEGLEMLGATRTRSLTYGLDYRDTDDAGDDIKPIFSRGWMGQTIIDWDTD